MALQEKCDGDSGKKYHSMKTGGSKKILCKKMVPLPSLPELVVYPGHWEDNSTLLRFGHTTLK